jgi:hypothetical protein
MGPQISIPAFAWQNLEIGMPAAILALAAAAICIALLLSFLQELKEIYWVNLPLTLLVAAGSAKRIFEWLVFLWGGS